MRRHLIVTVLGGGMWLTQATTVLAQHGWPIEAMGSEHPIGNSMGEYQLYGTGVYKHTGIDILGTPKYKSDGTEDTTAPWVRVTVPGTPTYLSDNAGTMYNGTTIWATDSNTYRYWHLEHGSYDPTYVVNFNNGTAVAAGDRVAKLVYWAWCSPGYHHLHYDLCTVNDTWCGSGNYVSPMADITPNPDPDIPQATLIGFAKDDNSTLRWTAFSAAGPGACSTVSGAADVVAQAGDRDDAGSGHPGAKTIWLYDVRWRACPDSLPACPWQNTHTFNNMPTAWGGGGNAATQAYFSSESPWISDSNYCTETPLFAVVTNFVAGAPSTAGRWDTVAIADGSYSVSVESKDFAGNLRTINARACVQNSTSCITELAIQDAPDDNSAIPYLGTSWVASPGITVNPGTPDEDIAVHIGAANPIDVRVWNYGSCNLAAGATYQVCLGWAPATPTVPHPLPAAQVIGCGTVVVPTGGWPVGTSRVTTTSWTPAAGTPTGPHAVVAWVDLAADPVLTSAGVNLDDNRAQQNVTFLPPPPTAPSALTCESKLLTPGWFIRLNWVDNSSDETDFHIERSPDGVTWAEIATVGANVTTYQDGVLPAKMTFHYRVRAHRHADGAFSAYTNVATCITRLCTPFVCPQIVGKVPAAVISAALADPESISGFCQLRNPGLPFHPTFNPRRNRLSVHNLSKPFHPLFNGLVFKAGCY